ncbi:hypothetical protein C2S52_001831 [Perilla frutescens var. hirtella]|nr:hypothetical protein C2S52_001831 [Perilla frutescens var. hirtella]
MERKYPVSIFTDQDLAIGTAIEQSFPDTRHRLCLWHLYQNAISRFGNLKANKSFINEFQKCLSGCTNREEFEHCWSSMISTYHLEDNSWFSRLYLLKEKWCTGLNNDFFSAGILSSQRSESTNSAIGFNARKSTSLTEFYDIFKRTVQSWRRNEASDEFQCSRAQPTSFMPLTGLLKHASEVYTLTLFTDFEAEFLRCISLNCELIHSDERLRFYNVKDDGGVIVHNVSFSDVVS